MSVDLEKMSGSADKRTSCQLIRSLTTSTSIAQSYNMLSADKSFKTASIRQDRLVVKTALPNGEEMIEDYDLTTNTILGTCYISNCSYPLM